MSGQSGRAGQSGPGHIGGSRWVLFGALLIAPNLALNRGGLGTGLWLVLAWWAILSVGTYLTYAADKRRAQSGDDRTPEATLHLLSLLGGWPGGLLAQGRYRHKTSKVGFQFVFWLTIAAHEALAIDYLLGWPITTALGSSLK